jgi:hypothetical protein
LLSAQKSSKTWHLQEYFTDAAMVYFKVLVNICLFLLLYFALFSEFFFSGKRRMMRESEEGDLPPPDITSHETRKQSGTFHDRL